MKLKVTKRAILPALLAVMLLALIFCVMALSAFATENANSDALIEEKYAPFSEGATDADTHPLVAFKKNGSAYSVIGTYAKLEDSYKAISGVSGAWNSHFVIALRKDALSTASADVLNGLTGSLKIDLCENTLTQNGSNFIYKMFRNVAASNNPDKRLSFSIENGSVVAATDKPLFALSYGEKCTNDLEVSFEFNSVNFVLKNKSASLFVNWENGYTSVPESFSFNIYAKFNDCVFDLKDAASAPKVFNLVGNNNYDGTVYDIEINGGSVIANSSFLQSGFMTLNNEDNGRADSVKFGKSKTTGAMTALVMPNSAAPGNDTYLGTNGEDYKFVKTSSNDEGDIYNLRPVATIGINFAPKMSITLDRDLIMNVYVPVTSILNSFTIDEKAYENADLGNLTPAVIDGAGYYLISIPLSAKEAAKDVKLVAKITVGDKIATASFTFNIPKYAEALISDSEEAEAELIRNVISYIRAAYDYFGTNDADAISKINKILGENYDENNKPVFEGQSVSNVIGFKSVTYVLKETAAMRFYLADGASAEDYKFYIGNKLVAVEEGIGENGAYVDIDVYAYDACETVTVKAADADAGSFHINSYYAFVSGEGYTGENKEKLVTLTERFWKYCQSAKKYRDSVISITHNYEEKLILPTCDAQGYTLYTCVDCGYSYVANYVDAHGHMFGDWYLSENVSKTSDGMLRQNCSNCDKYALKSLAVVSSGNLGAGSTPTDKAIYTIYEDGTLKVTGSGETYNCNWNCANQPFKEYRDFITRVIVCDGITKLGRGSFGYLKNLEYSELSDSLTEYPANLFMDSFKLGITSYTIPANITKIQQITIGRYDQKNALFTDVYIENPNIEIVDFANTNGSVHIFVNRYAKNCGDLTLYSYGADNNVKAYADKHGFKYVDLNFSFSGTADNVSYSFIRGVLTLSPIDKNKASDLPTDAPWLEKIEKSDITSIVIEQGITAIPDAYFMDHTSLTSVTLPKNLDSIGSMAFAALDTCANSLSMEIGDGLLSVSPDFLQNRTNVTIKSFAGTALDGYSQSGVSLDLTKAFKLLLIGNSLSNDAADVSVNKESQLYNIIKAMVGDDVYVEIGVLYSGAKTAAWHATVAELMADAYTFYLINEDTGEKWSSYSDYSSKRALAYDAWDIVTLQPYGNETLTGSADASSSSGNIAAYVKYYSLSESIPYLIDYVNEHCNSAKIYYYMTWSNSQTPALNAGLYNYNKMLSVAKDAIHLVGSKSERGFEGLIPVGTAIQNARSTYLALQYCVTDNDSDSFHFVKGLQRDNVHLNVTFGRYIAGLSFAEILVPESLRKEHYTLPTVADSSLIGALPQEYTALSRLAVEKMLESLTKTGDDQYCYTAIEGYESEPADTLASIIENIKFDPFSVADKAALIAAISDEVSKALPASVEFTIRIADNMEFSDIYQDCIAEISVSFGFTIKSVTREISAMLTSPSAEVVNKNGASAAVTFVVDDGNWDTARFAKEMLLKYPTLAITFAVPVKQIATLEVLDEDGDGIPSYVMVDDQYVYQINQNNVDFWMDILSAGNCEIVNHSYTHGFFGTNDDGGYFEYVKNGEQTVTVSDLLPEGSVTKEIYASKQLLEKVFEDYCSEYGALTLIKPGIGIRTVDYTLPDGTVIPSYITYFNEVIKKAYESGDLIGANGTFGATYDPSLDVSTKVVTSDRFATYEERMNTPRYMVEHYNANPDGVVNDDISNWTDYIDAAIDLNGWACFCIHIMLEEASANGHNITEDQAERLFKYAVDNNLWIVNNTEATLYYSEWATSKVETNFENGIITVSLTDEERDDVYNVALTVKVSVPDSWLTAISGDETYTVLKGEDGTSYVLVDIVPDSGEVTLVKGN